MAAVSAPLLKPLRRPHLWLGLWLLALAVVCVASLTPPPPMDIPKHGDKVEHLLAYAVLAAAAVQVFRPGRALWIAGIGLVLMGVGLEIAQGALTRTRMADPADALANTAGVLLGMASAATGLRDLLLRRGG